MRLDSDPIIRDEIAGLYAQAQAYRHHTYRTLTTIARGADVGPQASVSKIYWSEMDVRIHECGLRLMDRVAELQPTAGLILASPEPIERIWRRWHKKYWYARSMCIAAGTNEIQKNIVAERILELPREPRPSAA
jgi:alkylation response protein AidB-like acyl-CoA dehydrogenase